MVKSDFYNYLWAGLAIIGLALIACLSDYFLGKDNIIEKEAEEIAEALAEQEFHLPPGSLKLGT